MDETKKLQREALEMAIEYIAKLVPAFQTVSEELKTEKKEDTMDFMNQAIEGLNFVIEIFNAMLPLFNEKEEVFQKDVIEANIQMLNKAIKGQNDTETAQAIEMGVIPFLVTFEEIAKVYLGRETS